MGLRRALLLCMAISAGLARFVLDGKHIFRGWWTWVVGSKTSNDKPCGSQESWGFCVPNAAIMTYMQAPKADPEF